MRLTSAAPADVHFSFLAASLSLGVLLWRNGPRMNKFDLILRNVIIFLWPLPFLLGFAVERGGDWTAWVASIAVVVLVSAAVARAWVTSRRDR